MNCAYARPKAATPTYAPLTIAYKPCTSADPDARPPLASGSCIPPQQASDQLTVGTPDSNGRHVELRPGRCATGCCRGDVLFTFSMTDVRKRAGLSDYTGELVADQALRITDRNNGPGEPGTVSDTSFPVTIPCTATADTSTGSDCGIIDRGQLVASRSGDLRRPLDLGARPGDDQRRRPRWRRLDAAEYAVRDARGFCAVTGGPRSRSRSLWTGKL